MMALFKALAASAWLVPAGVSISFHFFVLSLCTLVGVIEVAERDPVDSICTRAEQEFEISRIQEGPGGDGALARELDSADRQARDSAPQKLTAQGLPPGIDRAGPAVNDLVLCLSASTPTIRPGERITFSTWICNRTDEDLMVEIGYSTTGDYLSGGTALSGLVDGAGAMPRHYFNGMCGTGAHPLHQKIPARSAVRHDCEWTFGQEPYRQGKPVLGYHRGPFLMLEAPAAGMHRFFVSLKASAESGKVCTKGLPALWAGSVSSNEVRIEALFNQKICR